MTAKALNRDDILNALDLPAEIVPVPRWGGGVLVKAMPMASSAYSAYINQTDKKNNPPSQNEWNQRRMVGAVILSALDPETEQPMFKWSDAKLLREKHWNSVLIVATKAFELAGGDGPEEVLGDDEELDLDSDDIIVVADTDHETPEDDPDAPKGE